MGYYSTVNTEDVLPLEQLKLNVCDNGEESMKAMTSELWLWTGKSGVSQEGNSREGRWQARGMDGNEMHRKSIDCTGKGMCVSHPGTFMCLAK